jgi:hypothetical protein
MRKLPIIAGWLFLSSFFAAKAQFYTMQALGPPPTSPVFQYASVGFAVNNKDEALATGVWGAYGGTPSMFLEAPDYGMPAGLDYLPFYGVPTNVAVLAINNWQFLTDTDFAPGPLAFNDDGVMLGTLADPTNACLWHNGSLTNLGTLGGDVSFPFALNQTGDIIGYSTLAPGNTNLIPFIIYAGTLTMQAIPGMDENSYLIGFNNKRQILFSSRTNYYYSQSLWQNGAVQTLGSIFGVTGLAPPAVNPTNSMLYADGTYNGLDMRILNDNGEMYGHLETAHIVNEIPDGTTYSSRSFFYSPTGGNGFQPGMNFEILSDSLGGNLVITMNNTGQIVYLSDYNTLTNPFSYDYYIWQNGQTKRVQDLVPRGTTWTDVVPRAINDRGDITGSAFSNGVSQAILLSLPELSATGTATPSRVTIGDTFEVKITAINNNRIAGQILTNVQFETPMFTSGSGGVSAQYPAVAPAPITLGPGQSAVFTQTFTATNYGTVNFVATVSAEDQQGNEQLAFGETTENIKLAADLLIKSGTPNDTTFAGGGEYQDVPFNDQNVTQPVASSGQATYVVRLQNNSPGIQSYVLRGATNSFPNWTIQATSGGLDIYSSLVSAGGWAAPDLDTGEYLDIQVTFTPMTNASVLDNKSFLVTALADSASTDVLDAVIMHAVLVPIPVQLTLRQLNASGLTPDSIQAGLTDINAPLVPVTEPKILAAQPEIHGGLVADGVTPLLIEVSADPALLGQFSGGRGFEIQAQTTGIAAIQGNTIGQRLMVLQDGQWQNSSSVVLSASSPNAFLELPPIVSEDLAFFGFANELEVEISLIDTNSQVDSGDANFGVRKPPIALIHGYNTTGDWGTDFKTILGASRPWETEMMPNNFICTVRYGQDYATDLMIYSGLPVYENTVQTLFACAQDALTQLNAAMAPAHTAWAFTRYDVVAHSQGGVLTRMLSSAAGNSVIPQAFRNADNFYRGRFHRVVTIGSPHNGTRLLHYLLALEKTGANGNLASLPEVVALVGSLSQVAQAKFDPFGPQFAAVNDPSPNAPWQPDPAAPFHLVRTVIDSGASPGTFDTTPSYIALALNTPLGGSAVIPAGSDGVVDFDSMGANVPPTAVGANVFSLDPANDVSHSGPTQVFASQSFQTESTAVATHVIGALDPERRAAARGHRLWQLYRSAAAESLGAEAHR